MKPKNDRTQLGRSPATGQPAPRKRFRIEKLEERIAPSGPVASKRDCPTDWKCSRRCF